MFLKFKKEKRLTQSIQDMTQYIQNESFLDYPILWRKSSCNGQGELIHFLKRNEKLFQKKEDNYCLIVETDFSKRTAGTIDILSIDGIEHSQNNNYDKYSNLYEFASSLVLDAKKFEYDKAVAFQTDNDFKKNCMIVKEGVGTGVFVKVQSWNGKKYIANNKDCSHHLAGIYRQCKEQGRTYKLHLDIVYENVNSKRLRQLLGEYYFVFSENSNLRKIDKKYELYFKESLMMHNFDPYKRLSYVFPFKKEFEFNKFLIKLLRDYDRQFLILNDELERLYL